MSIRVTIALIPVIRAWEKTGINPEPLWWALAFGAGFGGNGTIIGSSANIGVAMLSEKTRSPITAGLSIKRGMPVMMITCVVASLIFWLAYSTFIDERHGGLTYAPN